MSSSLASEKKNPVGEGADRNLKGNAYILCKMREKRADFRSEKERLPNDQKSLALCPQL